MALNSYRNYQIFLHMNLNLDAAILNGARKTVLICMNNLEKKG